MEEEREKKEAEATSEERNNLDMDIRFCWEPPGCGQTVTRPREDRGTCKAALPLRVVLGAQYVPFFFLSYCCWALLIFGNIIYSNKASLEKSKPFWKCS